MEQPSKDKRQSQVVEQYEKSMDSLSILHDNLNKLIERLSSVLRLELPCKTEESKGIIELVPLAINIAEIEISVFEATQKIRSILDRLEL